MKHKFLIFLVISILVCTTSVFSGDFLIRNYTKESQTYFGINSTSGYAGIGLSNPSYPLHVKGIGDTSGSFANPLAVLEAKSGYSSFISFKEQSSSRNFFMGRIDASIGNFFGIGVISQSFNIVMNSNGWIRFSPQGNLGIFIPIDFFQVYSPGSTYSSKHFDYASDFDSYVGFNALYNSTGSKWMITPSAESRNGAVLDSYILTTDDTALRFSFVDRTSKAINNVTTITKSGYFGINTISPTSPLSVNLPGWNDATDNSQHAIIGSGSGYGIRFGVSEQASPPVMGYVNVKSEDGDWGNLVLAYDGGRVNVGSINPINSLAKMSVNYTLTTNNGYTVYSKMTGSSGIGAAVRGDSHSTSSGSNYGGQFYSAGNGAGYNVGIYASASGGGTNYAIQVNSGQYCSPGMGSGCSLNDIAEEWHSEKSLSSLICNDSQLIKWEKCTLPNDFKLEFHNGDVVCALEGKRNILRECNSKYDKSAIGVISEHPTILLAGSNAPYKVSLSGNVPVNVICDEPIKVGDLLVYSGIENYAMKLIISDSDSLSENYDKYKGVFAKALENCEFGSKVIRAWV